MWMDSVVTRCGFLRPITASLLLFMIAGTAAGQSFDCHRAVSDVEHEICQHPSLGELDSQLASQLSDSLAAAVDQRQFLLETERQWIMDRDVRCTAANSNEQPKQLPCLEAAYRNRIQDLKDLTQIHRESAPVSSASTEKLFQSWQGDYGRNPVEFNLVVLPDEIDIFDGREACVRMRYRIVGRKDNLFFLEVSAPAQCISPGQRGKYLVLGTVEGLEHSLSFRDCSSARDLLKLFQNPSDGDVYCSQLGLGDTATEGDDSAAIAARLQGVEFIGGCDASPVKLTAQQVALFQALGFNRETEVLKILSHRVDVNFRFYGWTPLSVAAYEGNLSMVKALLKAGARFVHKNYKECGPETFDNLVIPSSGSMSATAIKDALLGAAPK